MIKNNKAVDKYNNYFSSPAPREDYKEVYYAFQKQGYGINWCFMDMDMLLKNIKAPTFWRTHKLLENATRKQLRKTRQ